MSSRPWLDAIENPEVEQELQQTAVAQAPSAPKKKLLRTSGCICGQRQFETDNYLIGKILCGLVACR